jgi:hypothetical protein
MSSMEQHTRPKAPTSRSSSAVGSVSPAIHSSTSAGHTAPQRENNACAACLRLALHERLYVRHAPRVLDVRRRLLAVKVVDGGNPVGDLLGLKQIHDAT